MPTDNVISNAGSGGATFRTLADGTSVEWPVSVAAYATTLSAGANVMQVVTPTNGLPIVPATGALFVLGAGSAAIGSVVANAGTNLNTSLLALEAGGNLATIAGKDFATQTTLSAINTKVPALGQALAASSVPVVMTAAQLSTLTPLSSVAVNNFPSGFLAAQSGSWNVAVTGSVAVTGAFWQATQPVSLSTLPALVAGTALVGKVGIDQTTPGTTNKVSIGTDGTVAVSGSVAVTGTFFQATQPVSGTFWQATQPVSGTVTANAGSGTLAISAVSLPLPSGASTAAKQPAIGIAGSASADVITVQGVTSMTALKVDGSGVTQPVSGSLTTVSTVTAVTAISNALPAGTNTLGGVNIIGSTTGGASSYHLVSASGNNATSVKGSAGTLKCIQAFNVSAAARYLKLYDTAGTPTAGSGAPKKVILIPSNASGSSIVLPPEGIAFASGIGFTTTTGIADADTGSVGAADLLIELDYK